VETAVGLLSELDSVADRLDLEHNDALMGIFALCKGAALLVRGAASGSRQILEDATKQLGSARVSADSETTRALARLLWLRAQNELIVRDRLLDGALAEDIRNLEAAIDETIDKNAARLYTSETQLACSYQLAVARAGFEVWAHADRQARSDEHERMNHLNRSFTFAVLGAGLSGEYGRAPLLWRPELAAILVESVLAGASLAVQGGNREVQAELTTFLRRLSDMYATEGLASLRGILRAMIGLLASHSNLQRAIFGVEGKVSEDQRTFLMTALQSGIDSLERGDGPDNVSVLYSSVKSTLARAVGSVE